MLLRPNDATLRNRIYFCFVLFISMSNFFGRASIIVPLDYEKEAGKCAPREEMDLIW